MRPGEENMQALACPQPPPHPPRGKTQRGRKGRKERKRSQIGDESDESGGGRESRGKGGSGEIRKRDLKTPPSHLGVSCRFSSRHGYQKKKRGRVNHKRGGGKIIYRAARVCMTREGIEKD